MARQPELDFDQMVGQMLFPELFGEAELDLVRRYRVGGVLVRRKHVKSVRQVVRLISRHQEAAALPLFVAAEFEWGVGAEVPSGTVFPGLLALGASGKESTARDVARVTAREAALIGVNQVLLPVLDLHPGASSPFTTVRAFGEDPSLVASLGVQVARAMAKNRLLATARHFPVQGDASAMKVKRGLPIVETDKQELWDRALLPYREVFKEGVGAVMISNVFLPAVSGEEPVPASLSPEVVAGLLRDAMGFDGLIMSGNLADEAVSKRFGPVRACREAIRAGCDMLLLNKDFLKPSQVLDLVRALERDEYLRGRVEESSARVLEAKRKLGLFKAVELSAENAVEQIGSENNRRTARRAALAGIFVQKNAKVLPLKPKKGEIVLVVTPKLPESLITGVKENWGHLYRAVKEFHSDTRPAYVSFSPTGAEMEKTLRAAERADHVIAVMAHEVGQPADGKQAELINRVVEAVPETVVAVLGNPFPAREVSDKAAAVLFTFSNMRESQSACAEVILGKAKAGGRMPVSL